MLLREFLELSEAPIGDWEIDPNFDQNEKKMLSQFHGYENERKHWPDSDKAAIRAPLVIRKIKEKFARVPYNFNLYFYQSTNPDYDPILQKGIVDLDWVKNKMGDETATQISKLVNPNAITIMLTNNLSDDGWISIRSPWMMAHRFAHALIQGMNRTTESFAVHNEFTKFVYTITKYGYGVNWPNPDNRYGYEMTNEYMDVYMGIIGQAVGSMRSARESKLTQSQEWITETFAQYLMTGKVTLRPLPKQIHADEQLTANPKRLEKVQKAWQQFPTKVTRKIDELLNSARGEIWVI